jgi:hypothetical protein
MMCSTVDFRVYFRNQSSSGPSAATVYRIYAHRNGLWDAVLHVIKVRPGLKAIFYGKPIVTGPGLACRLNLRTGNCCRRDCPDLSRKTELLVIEIVFDPAWILPYIIQHQPKLIHELPFANVIAALYGK